MQGTQTSSMCDTHQAALYALSMPSLPFDCAAVNDITPAKLHAADAVIWRHVPRHVL